MHFSRFSPFHFRMSSQPEQDWTLAPQTGPPGDFTNMPATDPIPTFDLDSDEPLPPLPAVVALDSATALDTSLAAGSRPLGEMWLDGDVLMCACPDCGAPMSVRLWLLAADCWRCETSIELSEEQQRQAEQLLRERERKKQLRTAASPSKPAPSPAVRNAQQPAPRPSTAGQKREVNGHTPAARPASQANAPPAARTQPAPSRPAPSRPAPKPQRRRRIASWLADTPAWFISLVMHLVLLTLLGLLTFDSQTAPPFITISTTVDRNVREGDNTHPVDPRNEFAFDLPLPKDTDLTKSEVREAMIRADQDARELRLAEDAPDPFLPDLNSVKTRMRSGDFAQRTLAARDPRVRTVLVNQEGGTTLTEAAVARGLRWLAGQQKPDGHWSLDGGLRSDPAATGLALLPFLGAGQTHVTGKYQHEVAAGLRWLLSNQQEDGDLASGSTGNSRMYAHGQCAIVLCEAFAVTGDEQLRIPAQKAIDFIVAAQHPEGGWRYEPGQAGDTSVLGWQLMALQSARAANLTVPPATLENASHYLDSVSSDDGARYAYQRGSGPTEVMTAEALLCRMYLGWTLDDQGLSQGVDWLTENHLPSSNRPNLYYWYYATQVFHHAGGLSWEKWNVRIRDILVNSQEKNGDLAGSWQPEHHHDRSGGRIYATSLAVCSLEVYYRHVPLFRQLDVE